MKVKSLALLAIFGLLAAAFTYAVPALADDSTMEDESSLQLAPASSDESQNNNAENGSNGDGAEADTASGDDDY